MRIGNILSRAGDSFSPVIDPLLSLFFPQACAVCAGSVEKHAYGSVCGKCWQSGIYFSGNEHCCEKCGSYLSALPPAGSSDCGECGDHEYDRARAAAPYLGAVREMLLTLKHSPRIPRTFRPIAADAFCRSGFGDCDLIVPVPLSKRRRAERGYNQAEIIAELVADLTVAAVDRVSLNRAVDTPMHRAGMDAKGRMLTVRDAFVIERPKLIAGMRIVLIDDVFTSGSTASACAKALKKNGAESVCVFTLARAVSFDKQKELMACRN